MRNFINVRQKNQMRRNEMEKATAQTATRSKLQTMVYVCVLGGVGEWEEFPGCSMFSIKLLWGRGARENPAAILRVMSISNSKGGGSPCPTIAKQGSGPQRYLQYT